jgi:hypothetical protein
MTQGGPQTRRPAKSLVEQLFPGSALKKVPKGSQRLNAVAYDLSNGRA